MPFLVAEELQTENVLSCCREVTDEGRPFWFQSSYRWRMPFLVSEELQTKDALSGFRVIVDEGYPLPLCTVVFCYPLIENLILVRVYIKMWNTKVTLLLVHLKVKTIFSKYINIIICHCISFGSHCFSGFFYFLFILSGSQPTLSTNRYSSTQWFYTEWLSTDGFYK